MSIYTIMLRHADKNEREKNVCEEEQVSLWTIDFQQCYVVSQLAACDSFDTNIENEFLI